MRIRVNAGMEDHRISNEWIAIVAVKTEKYAEMEMTHRGWILQELEARVGESSATWILRRDQRNRKAEARLLHDTLAMPGVSYIPNRRHAISSTIELNGGMLTSGFCSVEVFRWDTMAG